MGDCHVVDVVRIRLDGDLSVARNRRAASNGGQYVANAKSTEARGCAAAEVNRVEGCALEAGAEAVQLFAERGHVLVHGRARSHGDREVAIRAASGAEGDVDVQMARGDR